MTPAPDTAVPPQAPDVSAQQQGSSLAEYTDRARRAGVNAMQPQTPTGIELVEKIMNNVAQELTDVAKVLQMTWPMGIEYVKKMSQVGAPFMQELQQFKQKQSQGQGPNAGLAREQAQQGSPSEGQSGAAVAA